MERTRWISIKDKMPPALQKVYVATVWTSDNGRVIRGQTIANYVPPMSIEEEYFMAEEFWGDGDYDEDKDKYYAPTGFYEWQMSAEINYMLSEEVTHWMPLFPLPEL